MLRATSLLALLLLCACQTITAGTTQQGGPSPAFRKEIADRLSAFHASHPGLLSPHRVTEASISKPYGGVYCATLSGGGRDTSIAFSYFYDKKGAHVGSVYNPDPDEEAQYCGDAYSFPEAVGLMF